MGINYYFRRDDNRTRYFLGKTYALARRFGQLVPIVVTEAGMDLNESINARDLAGLMEVAYIEDGHPPPKQDARDRTLALAVDVARWSCGMPISLVSEDRFEDWQDDDSWDEVASTAEFGYPR